MNRHPFVASLVFTAFSLLAGAALIGCGESGGEDDEGGGPTMKAGQACLACHSAGGSASEERFTAAGTVYADAAGSAPLEGATVTITDDAGKQVELTSNSVGNFYTSKSLTFPLSITVTDGTSEATMASGAPNGDCNSCHAPDGDAGARIYVP